LLQIDPGAPLILIKRLIKTKDGRFFQYSKDLYRSDKLNFTVQTMAYDESRRDFVSPLSMGTKGSSPSEGAVDPPAFASAAWAPSLTAVSVYKWKFLAQNKPAGGV
jgi:hypothetical protein